MQFASHVWWFLMSAEEKLPYQQDFLIRKEMRKTEIKAKKIMMKTKRLYIKTRVEQIADSMCDGVYKSKPQARKIATKEWESLENGSLDDETLKQLRLECEYAIESDSNEEDQ